jgi:hypothetical protein
MAIVINGSGTVTGLAVGGLPDGTVDAGTLATNSVDSAELIDGAIDTAHIAANQITSAIMPAGSIVQVVQSTFSGSSSIATSSDAWQAIGNSVSITPSRTSSKILFTCSGFTPHVNPSANNNGTDVSLYQQVASGGYSKVEGTNDNATSYWKDSNSWIDMPGHFEVMYTPSYTSGQQINLQPYFRRADSNVSSHYFHHHGGAGAANIIRLIAMEIAG